MARNVADTAFDGTTIAVRMGAFEAHMTKISYGDSIEPAVIQRLGSQEVDATTLGAYKIDDITATMEKKKHDELLSQLAKLNGGSKNGIGNVRFPISVTYSHPEVGTVHDVIEQAQMVGFKSSAETGGAPNMVEMKIKARQILWNGRSINARRGA